MALFSFVGAFGPYVMERQADPMAACFLCPSQDVRHLVVREDNPVLSVVIVSKQTRTMVYLEETEQQQQQQQQQ